MDEYGDPTIVGRRRAAPRCTAEDPLERSGVGAARRTRALTSAGRSCWAPLRPRRSGRTWMPVGTRHARRLSHASLPSISVDAPSERLRGAGRGRAQVDRPARVRGGGPCAGPSSRFWSAVYAWIVRHRGRGGCPRSRAGPSATGARQWSCRTRSVITWWAARGRRPRRSCTPSTTVGVSGLVPLRGRGDDHLRARPAVEVLGGRLRGGESGRWTRCRRPRRAPLHGSCAPGSGSRAAPGSRCPRPWVAARHVLAATAPGNRP